MYFLQCYCAKWSYLAARAHPESFRGVGLDQHAELLHLLFNLMGRQLQEIPHMGLKTCSDGQVVWP